MNERDCDLGAAELEVLRVLWDEGPATVRDVLNRLNERGRGLAYTTVQTFLTRLEQKGFVRSNKSDLAFVFRAKVSRDKISRSRLRSLLDELYDGAAGPLALQLIRQERFTRDEIDELQKLIDRLDSKGRKAGR
ncbi:MAG: BlaI/MecI/CopY family transcriptional regulator [Planctomycetes bacterium]|nr:BlaI/MecI/CopY family transcriptional regulator [Planctomycetota bacterium]